MTLEIIYFSQSWFLYKGRSYFYKTHSKFLVMWVFWSAVDLYELLYLHYVSEYILSRLFVEGT